jgi:type IV secretion system protein VirB8
MRPQKPHSLNKSANMNMFTKGSAWETSRVADIEKSRKIAWIFSGIFAFGFVVAAIALASLAPLRRTVPYVVKQDTQTGNIEVLQSFDNRQIGNQELMDKYWARSYVQAREQYNWWFIAANYDTVTRLTDPTIAPEYVSQFEGEKALDKIFGDFTDRRIKVLSISPAPDNPKLMTVRFERTTVSRGAVVETPTIFVVTMAYRYVPKTFGAEIDLIRNPMGYQVFAYRRDAEQAASAAQPVSSPAAGTL